MSMLQTTMGELPCMLLLLKITIRSLNFYWIQVRMKRLWIDGVEVLWMMLLMVIITNVSDCSREEKASRRLLETLCTQPGAELWEGRGSEL